MLRRMEFKTIAFDTREGHLNTDRIYQLGYLLYEIDTNMGKFSDGEHHFKDLPYFVGEGNAPQSSFKGLWNSETEYNEGDIVFDENDIYYMVIKRNIGEIPSKSSSYLPLNKKETSENPYKGEYSSDKKYSKGDYVINENDFYISINDNPGGIPLSDTNYWKLITDDHLVTMKYQNNNIDAKICLSTIDIKDCDCDCGSHSNCKCKCHTGIDDIKLSKDFSPTVNLKTGVLKIPGILIPEGGIDGFIDETSFNNLVERVRIIEEKINELESKLN